MIYFLYTSGQSDCGDGMGSAGFGAGLLPPLDGGGAGAWSVSSGSS